MTDEHNETWHFSPFDVSGQNAMHSLKLRLRKNSNVHRQVLAFIGSSVSCLAKPQTLYGSGSSVDGDRYD